MSFFGANQQAVTARGTTIEGGLLPDHAGPEADAEARAAIVRLAGPPSVAPLSATLAGLIESWFSPLGIGDGGEVRGYLDRVPVQVNASNVRDVLRRPGLAGQLGFEATSADLDAALVLVGHRARAEHERQAVAEQHARERERAELVEDAEVARRRAALLRELAELDDAPKTPAAQASRPVPGPPSKRGWRR